MGFIWILPSVYHYAIKFVKVFRKKSNLLEFYNTMYTNGQQVIILCKHNANAKHYQPTQTFHVYVDCRLSTGLTSM